MEEKNQECEVLNNVTMKPECALNSVNIIDYLKMKVRKILHRITQTVLKKVEKIIFRAKNDII